MARFSGGLAASIGLMGCAVMVGSWFAVGSALAAGTEPPTVAAEWAPMGGAVAAPIPPPVSAPTADAPNRGQRVDQAWLRQVAAQTGVAERALAAYAAAELVLLSEQPQCGIGWNTLAGIGQIETHHGSYGGAVLQPNGDALPRILGPALDGNGVAAIPDTDSGAWDSDVVWDRAVGPMQFIPSTWAIWGADASGDGRSDPNNIDDAALAAARYLCASGSMLDAPGWRAAIFSYNHLDSYVDDVAHAANEYAESARVRVSPETPTP